MKQFTQESKAMNRFQEQAIDIKIDRESIFLFPEDCGLMETDRRCANVIK